MPTFVTVVDVADEELFVRYNNNDEVGTTKKSEHYAIGNAFARMLPGHKVIPAFLSFCERMHLDPDEVSHQNTTVCGAFSGI